MKITHILIPALALALIGCKDKAAPIEVNINPEPDVKITGTVDVKATTHIFPKEQIVKATIAPKSGMRAFSSKILLLSDTGKLYATDTAFPQLELIHAGPITDISGFYLADNSSGFLAREAENTMTAYLDMGSGKFEKIALDGLPADVGFCEDRIKRPGQITLSLPDSTTSFDVSFAENTLSFTPANDGQFCGKGREFVLSDQERGTSFLTEKTAIQVSEQVAASEIYKTFILSSGLATQHDQTAKGIKVVDGLSIDGLATSQWIYSTSQPLGNTFNAGVTLIRGDDQNRIVMIANDYLAKTVFGSDQ